MIIFYLCCGVLMFFAAYILDVIRTENSFDRLLAVMAIVLLWPLVVSSVIVNIVRHVRLKH